MKRFTVSGPAISKERINFDPSDPRRSAGRWFKAVMPLLKSYYGTGGDMNIDESRASYHRARWALHPQEGVVVGHFVWLRWQGPDYRTQRKGVSLRVEDPVTPVPENTRWPTRSAGAWLQSDPPLLASMEACESGSAWPCQGWGTLRRRRLLPQPAGALIVGIIDRHEEHSPKGLKRRP